MASGRQLAVLLPDGYEPPDTNPATPGSIVAATGRRPTLDFDPATDETAIWSGVLRGYDGGGLTVDIYGAMSAANTTDDVVLDVAIERVVVGAVLGAAGSAFAAVNSVTVTADDTASVVFKATVTFTDGADMDSLADGEPYRILVTRDANAAGDTAAGDFRLVAVEVRET